MATEFRPAVRDKTSTLIALAGASGSGKTFTAILMAVGLAYPGMTVDQIIATVKAEGRNRIAFLDSEGGRGKHYAPGPDELPDCHETFPYDYAEITAPYSPENYKEAITAADEAGYDVIIVDSMSHEYESEGGIQEIADQAERGVLKPGMTMQDADGRDGWKAWLIKPEKSPGNWSDAKTRHKRMVNRAIQARAHVIFCLRAEEKMLLRQVPVLDRDGEPAMWNGRPKMKTEVIPAEQRPIMERWVPICEKRFMYEMTVSFLLLPGEPGVGYPIKNLQAKFQPMFPEGQRLGVENGRLLANWSAGRKAELANETRPRDAKVTPEDWTARYISDLSDQTDVSDLQAFQARNQKAIDRLRKDHPKLFERVTEANANRFRQIMSAGEDHMPNPADDETFPSLESN